MEIDFDFLADSIKAGRAVLFLGAGISYNYENPNNEQETFSNLLQEMEASNLSWHQKDGLFILRNTQKSRLVYKLKPFYQDAPSHELLGKLAEIPFHLFINLTPDLALKKTFEARNFAHTHSFYKRRKEILEMPSQEMPLLYHLFGCAEGGKDDLYLTHSDLFEYIKAVYNPDSALPDALLACIRSSEIDSIIFLGCDFEKWYFQLLLDILRIKEIENNNSIASHALEWREVFENGFKVTFVEGELAYFVQELHQRIRPQDLRTPIENIAQSLADLKQKLTNLTEAGEYAKVFKMIEENTHIAYDKHNFNALREEFTFTITLALIKRLLVFITTLELKP